MGATSEYYIKIQDELINTIHQVKEGELSHLDGLIKLRDNKSKLEDSLGIIKEFEDSNLNEIEREASKYPDGYMGKEITVVSGRKTYDFKGIDEVEEAERNKKATEEKYRSAFDGFQKGIVQTTKLNEEDPDSPLGWVDENGQVLKFPKLNISKSYITVKQSKPKK